MPPKFNYKSEQMAKAIEAVHDWLIKHYVGKSGFPVTKEQPLDSAQLLIKSSRRDNNLTNGRPGRHWYKGFSKKTT